MSSKTKIVVLKARELIYTGIFILLGILLILLLIFMFVPSHKSISLKNLNKSIKTMYPLIEPSLNEINKQLPKVQNIDDIKFDGQSQYTYTLLKQAIKNALKKAQD